MLAVTVIGNIGNDAEIKEFNGQKFIAFNVASTERYKDGQGNQHSRTTWVSCLKPGESSVVSYLKKGTQVYVRGSLSVKTFNSGKQETQNEQQQPATTSTPPTYTPAGSASPFPPENEKDDLPF